MFSSRGALISALLAWILLLAPVQAGVYKYQDENGKWHFTDKPPEGQNSTAVSTSTTGSGGSSDSSKGDLKDLLHPKYNPSTPIDEASLSVVTVQTTAGSGSGFFAVVVFGVHSFLSARG